MSYSDENYGGKQGYGNDSEPDEIDSLQKKYGLDGSNSKSQPQSSDQRQQDKAYAQAKMAAEFGRQARSDTNDATFQNGQNSLWLASRKNDQDFAAESNSRKLVEGIDKDKVAVDNNFKASQSKLDRDKSIDEFTQNRYQAKQNQAQDRANLEYSTVQGLAKDKQGQDAELARLRASGDVASALADKTNNANLNLANITATTERSGQTSAVDRARLAANAQIKAALFAPRQYSGY